MTLPQHARYVVIGAGIHGLSTAWHLVQELEARGEGDGRDVVIVDKTGVGAGPSGIACGVIRDRLLPARDARADGALRRCLGVGFRRCSTTTRSATCRSRRR